MSNMNDCPLCQNKSLIQIPNSQGRPLQIFRQVGDEFQSIPDHEVHHIGGPDCWQNGLITYKGERRAQLDECIVYTPAGTDLNRKFDYDWGYTGKRPRRLAQDLLEDYIKHHICSLHLEEEVVDDFLEKHVRHWKQVWQIPIDTIKEFLRNEQARQ